MGAGAHIAIVVSVAPWASGTPQWNVKKRTEPIMKRLSISLFAMFLLIGVGGCSDTGIGAGVGAGGGALVGSTVGHPWLGALVGGAGGAVVGHEVGEHNNGKQDR